MSDILIKNMEMPKGCSWFDEEGKYHSCRFCFGYVCSITGICIAASVEKRPRSCPLIPVPEHGRLGDLDVMKEAFEAATQIEAARDKGNEQAYANRLRLVHGIIDRTPTVLEAST